MAKVEQWYVEEDLGGYVLRGYVSGHKRLPDGGFIRTTHICKCKKLDHVYVFKTYNTKYFCRFDECDFANCAAVSVMQEFEIIKADYMEKGE